MQDLIEPSATGDQLPSYTYSVSAAMRRRMKSSAAPNRIDPLPLLLSLIGTTVSLGKQTHGEKSELGATEKSVEPWDIKDGDGVICWL
jgi:hypothetical protein